MDVVPHTRACASESVEAFELFESEKVKVKVKKRGEEAFEPCEQRMASLSVRTPWTIPWMALGDRSTPKASFIAVPLI